MLGIPLQVYNAARYFAYITIVVRSFFVARVAADDDSLPWPILAEREFENQEHETINVNTCATNITCSRKLYNA